MELASLVRMGVSNKVIDMDIAKLNELTVKVQPATMNSIAGRNLDSRERDILRAEWVRKALN